MSETCRLKTEKVTYVILPSFRGTKDHPTVHRQLNSAAMVLRLLYDMLFPPL
jgi:hypothetical protein